MPKILWVALPLIVASAWLALFVLRRRALKRPVLNAWTALLLAAYIATTAGLGLFWVANQQLPVFDWHYLFGYATVLLVAVHVALNWRSAWRNLAGARAARPADVADDGAEANARRERRPLLALLGVALAAGAGYLLGLRHGRVELRAASAAAPETGPHGEPALHGAAALALVERFHAFSSHTRTGVLARAPSVDWGVAPPPFKRVAGAPTVGLPPPRTPPGEGFGAAALGALLWHTAGVTATRAGIALRASPSSGALFATELYVAVRDVAGIEPGLWHYDARGHALERLRTGPVDATALGAPGEPALDDAPAAVVATAVFRRTGHKYRDRAYRYLLADLGHALENLRVAALACGLRAQPLARFDEERAVATLGVDESEEGVLALVMLGARDGRAPAVAAARSGTTRWLPPGDPTEPEGLGVTAAMHRMSSLRAAPAASSPAGDGEPPEPGVPAAGSLSPGAPASAPASAGPAPAGGRRDRPPSGAIALPAGGRREPRDATGPGVLARIAARRSVRRFAATPLGLDALAGVLAAMAGREPPVLSSAVRVDVVVHAVAGLAPGAYRYEPAEHVLRPRRIGADLRRTARAAAFDQDVVGDAAVVFVLAIDRATIAADALGPARAYRHAFLEAGMHGERVYLEGGARGLGVCSVGAFYDDEAAALVALDPAREWVAHLVALGVPTG